VTGRRPRAVVLRLAEVGHIDATGLHALEQFRGDCARRGIRFLLAGVRPRPRMDLDRAGFTAALGEGNFPPTVEAALERLEAS
jgi:anti-anti-sigma regulatory factor